jgi:hypothetical protein
VGVDPNTGAIIDNSNRYYSFVNDGQNIVNTAIVQAAITDSQTTQDEKTGNKVFARKQYEPTFSFVTSSTLNTLQNAGDPLILGAVKDTNARNIPTITGTVQYIGQVKGDKFVVINPSPDLLSTQLLGQRLIPDITQSTQTYRIFRIKICNQGYGYVTAGTSITTADLNRLSELLGEDITTTSTQNKIKNGTIDLLEFLRADLDSNGIIDATDYNLLNNFINGSINSFPAGSYFTTLEMEVQQAIGRTDGYYSCQIPGNPDPRVDVADLKIYGINGYDSGIAFSSLSTNKQLYFGNYSPVEIEVYNSNFTTVPFVAVDFRIENVDFWMPDYLTFSANTRKLPCVFSYNTGLNGTSCSSNSGLYNCQDTIETKPATDPGRNDILLPANLILNPGAKILLPDGSNYKPDLEIGMVVLELPTSQLINKILDIFNYFCCDRGDGHTIKNFPAMKYASCKTVRQEDLFLNKLRYDVTIQSYVSKNAIDGYVGISTPGLIGNVMDQTTGLLTIYLNNLVDEPLNRNLVTRLTIKVYLRESGFNNVPLTLTADQLSGLWV